MYTDLTIFLLLQQEMYDAYTVEVKLRLPPHLYSVTPIPSKTHTTANIDATFSNV